jgi:hypothetical protein
MSCIPKLILKFLRLEQSADIADSQFVGFEAGVLCISRESGQYLSRGRVFTSCAATFFRDELLTELALSQ